MSAEQPGVILHYQQVVSKDDPLAGKCKNASLSVCPPPKVTNSAVRLIPSISGDL
jgi:hypothetical protein